MVMAAGGQEVCPCNIPWLALGSNPTVYPMQADDKGDATTSAKEDCGHAQLVQAYTRQAATSGDDDKHMVMRTRM